MKNRKPRNIIHLDGLPWHKRGGRLWGDYKTCAEYIGCSWSSLADQIAQIEKGMRPTRHPRDDVAWEIGAWEIRIHLRQLDPMKAEGRVLAAAESGDDEFLQAIMYSPLPFKLVPAGLLDKISQQRWAREYPADAAKLHDLRTAEGEARSALGSVKDVLLSRGWNGSERTLHRRSPREPGY